MFTHTVAQPYDKIGFGARTEGYEPNIEQAFYFYTRMGTRKDMATHPPVHQFQRARLGELSPPFVKRCRIIFYMADRFLYR